MTYRNVSFRRPIVAILPNIRISRTSLSLPNTPIYHITAISVTLILSLPLCPKHDSIEDIITYLYNITADSEKVHKDFVSHGTSFGLETVSTSTSNRIQNVCNIV